MGDAAGLRNTQNRRTPKGSPTGLSLVQIDDGAAGLFFVAHKGGAYEWENGI